jgi:signal transduction histidine kinase/CheY-like chemotaxis protein
VYIIVQDRLGKFKQVLGTIFQLCFFTLLVSLISSNIQKPTSKYQYYFVAIMERIIMVNCKEFPGAPIILLLIFSIRYALLTPTIWLDIVCLVMLDSSFWLITLHKTFPNKSKYQRYQTHSTIASGSDEILKSLTSQSLPCPFALINKKTQAGVWINEKLSIIMKHHSISDFASFLGEISLDLKNSRITNSNSNLHDSQPIFTLSDYLKSNNNADHKPIDRYIAKANLKSSTIYYDIREADGIFEGQDVKLLMFFDLSEQEAIKKLKEVGESKDRALATVSHDLRTPLNGIIGLIKIIEQQVDDMQVMKYLSACKSLAAIQLNIVNTYLDASQIEKKKLKLIANEFSLKEFLEELNILYGLLCKQKKIKFKVKLGERLPRRIQTDKNRLRQILINLLSNSLKFTDKGYISLHVKPDETNQDLISFSVEDSGLGIKEEDQDKLFKAFSTIENVTFNPYGVGLGLIISNQLAIMLNPRTKLKIKVESKLGKGSTFSFKIAKFLNGPNPDLEKSEELDSFDESDPGCSLADHENHDFDIGSANTYRINSDKFYSLKSYDFSPKSTGSLLAESPYDSNLFRGGRQIVQISERSDYVRSLCPISKGLQRSISKHKYVKKISQFAPKEDNSPKHAVLVIDDNPFNSLGVSSVLEQGGYMAVSFTNGQEGINELIDRASEGNFYKLVLMDCEMPGMDGFETTKKIKDLINQNKIPNVPIIALTAHDEDEVRTRCEDAGMTTVMTKPVRSEQLMKLLRELI